MKTLRLFLSLLVLSCVGTVTAVAQTILVVDNNPGTNAAYTDVQAAHDAAAAGDIIYVQPSASVYGAITITKPITIVGRSHSEPNKESYIGNINIEASNVEVKGIRLNTLRIRPTTPNPIPIAGIRIYECEFLINSIGLNTQNAVNVSNVEYRGNHIRDLISINRDASDVLISNNLITSSSIQVFSSSNTVFANNVFRTRNTGVSIQNEDTNFPLNFFNNMFVGNSPNQINVNLADNAFGLQNNLFYNFGAGDFGVTTSSGGSVNNNAPLLNVDPLFTDVDASDNGSFAGFGAFTIEDRPADDFSLQMGSPALTASINGDELGVYNTGFRFQKLGNPRGIPLLDILNYDSAVPAGGTINVTVRARAN